MSSYINVFLKTELTPIPSILNKYFGLNYNNTLCNGATWMLLLWYFLHLCFDALLNALLKRMKIQAYVRTRLKRSFWYLGFYGCALIYSIATLRTYSFTFFKLYNGSVDKQASTSQLTLGFVVLVTFYLHSAVWEGLRHGNGLGGLTYFCLFLLCCFYNSLRLIPAVFRLTILVASTQIALELTKSFTVLNSIGVVKDSIVSWVLFGCYVFCFLTNYVFLNVLLMVYPLIYNVTLFTSLIIYVQLNWTVFELYNSSVYKIVCNYFHSKEGDYVADLLNNSLFGQRTDEAYILKESIVAIRKREEEEFKMRKPKNRNVVMQTLKCMVTIKRKLKEKRKKNEQKRSEEDEMCLDECPCPEQSEDVVGGKLEFNIQAANSNLKAKED